MENQRNGEGKFFFLFFKIFREMKKAENQVYVGKIFSFFHIFIKAKHRAESKMSWKIFIILRAFKTLSEIFNLK